MSRLYVAYYLGSGRGPGAPVYQGPIRHPAAVQEAMGLRRMAHERFDLQQFCRERGMLTGARVARSDMMKLLCAARDAWRRALGRRS
jgi:hypothetical protein